MLQPIIQWKTTTVHNESLQDDVNDAAVTISGIGPTVSYSTNDDTNGGHLSARLCIDFAGHSDCIRVLVDGEPLLIEAGNVTIEIDGAWEGHGMLENLKKLFSGK